MKGHWIAAAFMIIGTVSMSTVGVRAQDAIPEDWSEMQRICTESGLNSKDVEEILLRCRKQGLTIMETHSMLSPVCEAGLMGLATKPATEKIEEGLAKGVPPEAIKAAVAQRIGHLRSAVDITLTANPKLCTDEVIIPAALAMESGVPERLVKSVIEVAKNKRSKEIRAAMEAGETLHLAGFSPEEIEPILVDCLNRNLRRVEFQRVVRYASQQRKRGMEAQRIRQSLWGNGAEGSQQRLQQREERGEGHRGGPGHGGPPHDGDHGQP